MQVRLVRPNVSTLKTDVLVLLQAEGQKRPELETALSAFYETGEIKGKLMEFTLLHGVAGYAASRVLLAGSGKPDKLTPATLGKLAAAAMRFLKGKGISEVTFALDTEVTNPANVAAIAEGVLVGAWEPDQLKTEKGD